MSAASWWGGALFWWLACGRPALPPDPDFAVVKGVAWRTDALGGDIVQATGRGRLILRDRRTLRVVREIATDPVSAVGDTPDGPLIGRHDGVVLRLGTEGLTPLDRVPGAVRWIGGDALRTWVVYQGEERWVVRPLDGDQAWPAVIPQLPHDDPSAFSVVGGRLWAGWDGGEWGGGYMGFAETGPVARAHLHLTTVHGFTADGYFYGGMLHFTGDAYVGRVGEVQPVMWSCWMNHFWGPENPHLPQAPIHHVLDTPDGRIATVFGEIWSTDRRFSRWTLVRTVDVAVTPGRPDAMGAYDPVKSAWRDPDGTILLATSTNGFVAVRPNGREVRASW